MYWLVFHSGMILNHCTLGKNSSALRASVNSRHSPRLNFTSGTIPHSPHQQSLFVIFFQIYTLEIAFLPPLTWASSKTEFYELILTFVYIIYHVLKTRLCFYLHLLLDNLKWKKHNKLVNRKYKNTDIKQMVCGRY